MSLVEIQVPRTSSSQMRGLEQQHSSQHLMGPEPAEPGAQEAQVCGGSHDKMGGTVQPSSSTSQRQDSCQNWQRVSSRGSWQSLGMESSLGDQPWQSGWQPQRQESQLSTDSRERAEQAQGTVYSPEEEAVWISRRTTRKVTNRSQQTSQVWSQKALSGSLKSSAQKSASSIDRETRSVKGAEKEISDTCSETRQPRRQESRCGSEKVPGWDSVPGNQQDSVQELWCGGSQRVSRQESWCGSQRVSGQESPCGSQHTLGQESQHSSKKVLEQQSQPHQPGEEKSEQHEKPSDDGLLLVLQLQCNNLQGIEVLVEEQVPESWRKRSQERARGVSLQLSQGSVAGQGEAWKTFNLFSQEGGTWTGRTGKILISCDEETGNIVIQTNHETQHPPGQPSQSEGVTIIPEERNGAEAEKPKVVGHESWRSDRTDRGGEAASELPAASHSSGGLLGMAVAMEMAHKVQQTHSVITVDEELWVRRRTGKLLRNKSQQTSISALRKSSSVAQEQKGAGGSISGQREGREPQSPPSDMDVPALHRRTSSRSSQLPGQD